MKKRFLFAFLLFSCLSHAQLGLQWATGFNGGLARGNAIFTDPAGNVYTTGEFQGTVDFDPGPGSLSYTAQLNNPDGFIAKQDGAGNLIWAKHFAGDYTLGLDITVDKWGYVYVTGYFRGVVDFDPGPGTYTLTGNMNGFSDPFVLKLSPAGNFVWIKQLASGNGYGVSIACDTLANIVFTGWHQGISDFDPGPGTYTLQCAGVNDAFVCKLDSAGSFLWAGSFGGNNCQASGADMVVDSAGSVYMGALFRGTIDIDPSAAVYTIASSGFTVTETVIAKFSKNGVFKWAKVFGGGSINFSRDGFGNIYCGGSYYDTKDFDPGPNTVTYTAVGQSDIYMLKLDSTGSYLWSRTIGSVFGEYGNGVAARRGGGMVLGGDFIVSLDFDPGPSVFTMTSNSGTPYVMQLDAAGNFDWAGKFTGLGGGATTGAGSLADVCLDANNVVHGIGLFVYSVDFDPGPGVYSLSSLGNNDDVFVVKLCTGSAQLSAISGPTLVCTGTTQTFTPWPSNGGGTFTWSVPAGWTTTNTVNGIIANVTQAGAIALTTGNSCGISPSRTLNVSVAASPTVLVTAPLQVCTGATVGLVAGGANSYSWNTGSNTASIVVTSGSNASYSVTGTSNGCAVTVTTGIVSLSLPTISIVGSSTVCSGSSMTLQGMGAASYSWNTGAQTQVISATPSAANNVFSVIGTGVNSCSATANITVALVPVPALTVTTHGAVCAGNASTLSVSGASSYIWSTGATSTVISLAAPVSTVLTVTGSFTNGCQSTANATVLVNALPVLGITGDTVLCMGQAGTLVAFGASSYSWNNGATGAVLPIQLTGNTTFTLTGVNNQGCTSVLVQQIILSECTGIQGQISAGGLELYPNPANGLLQLRITRPTENCTLSVLNALGQCVLSIDKIPGSIQLEQLPEGVYFILILEKERSILNEKLVIAR